METFKKRQKEMRRLEKQRDKTAKRMQRKLNRGAGEGEGEATPSADAPEAATDDKPAVEPTTGQ